MRKYARELLENSEFSTRTLHVGVSKWFAGVHGISKLSRKSMHEVIVFEVCLTQVKTNEENISTLQLLEGKKMLLYWECQFYSQAKR